MSRGSTEVVTNEQEQHKRWGQKDLRQHGVGAKEKEPG